MSTAPGWWWRFPLMMVLIAGFFMLLTATVGPALVGASAALRWVLVHVSDAIGGLS